MKLSGIMKTISQMQINKTELFSSWFHILLRFHNDLDPRNKKVRLLVFKTHHNATAQCSVI